MAKKVKFKKNKKYKIVKSLYKRCVGCILRYEGVTGSEDMCYGKAVSLFCKVQDSSWRPSWICDLFQKSLDFPDDYKLVEYTDMVKFCKKLRKKLRKDEV